MRELRESEGLEGAVGRGRLDVIINFSILCAFQKDFL